MKGAQGLVIALFGACVAGAGEITWDGGLSLRPEAAEFASMRRLAGDTFSDGGGTPAIAATSDGALDCRWDFAPQSGIGGDIVRLWLDRARYADGSVSLDGKRVSLPTTYDGKTHLFAEKVSALTVWDAAGGETMRLVFPEPIAMHAMDERAWNVDRFVIRFEKPSDGTAAGAVAFTLKVSGRRLAVRERPPYLIRKGVDWIPVSVSPEVVAGSAVDFSSLLPVDTPIGKHGRVVVRDGHFELAGKPGERLRFVGCNICTGANYLRSDLVDPFVRRLRQHGYNALRLHHHDAGLTEGSADGTTLNAGNLGLLDGLMDSCVRQGLYVTTDLFVSRTIPCRAIGMDKDGAVGMDEFKRLVLVHEGAYSNLCAFAKAWLTHVNPHTGRRWADEPALALVAFVNEGHLGMEGTGCLRQHPEFVSAWEAWTDPLGKKPATIPDGLVWEKTDDQACVGRFLSSLEMKFAARFSAFLREEVGTAALLSDMSAGMEREEFRPVRESAAYDYVDEHFYWDHPSWPKTAWSLPARSLNANPIRSRGADVMADASKVRVAGKPFVMTEWDFTGPSAYRLMAGLVGGAEAAKEDWDGLWRFSYAGSPWEAIKPQEVRAGFFSISGDPLVLAGERAAMCLFGRGDLAAGDAGAVSADKETGAFSVATARTAGGFSESGVIRAGALVAKCDKAPTVLWASSLDGEALSASGRILVTHLTDLQNTDQAYADASRTITLDWGKMPHLMRRGRAQVALDVKRGGWALWALSGDGARKRRLPYSYTEKGRLTFTVDVALDPKDATWLYELVQE